MMDIMNHCFFDEETVEKETKTSSFKDIPVNKKVNKLLIFSECYCFGCFNSCIL